MRIRKAVIGDVKAIHRVLNHYAEKGLLLPRSLSELYDHLRDFYVWVEGGPEASGSTLPSGRHAEDGVLGVCGLRICWEDLAEIKSLAVWEGRQGERIGSKLVETCLQEARYFGLRKVFTLTYVPGFFERLGFREVEKSVLPHKIWADRLKCPRFPNCDETALMIEL